MPIEGETRSNQIGVFIGSAILFGIPYGTIRWVGAKRLSEQQQVGLIWLLLTVSFEVLLGQFVVGLTWDELAAGYDVRNGGFLPLGLLFLFFQSKAGENIAPNTVANGIANWDTGRSMFVYLGRLGGLDVWGTS